MAQIIGLFGSFAQARPKRDWSNQDLAELYRVEAALIQAGLRIDTERGVSDEGDPWFVFCHGDNGDVIAHFARIDGRYVIASPALPKAMRGPDLGSIVRSFVEDNPVSLPSPENSHRGNVVFHPAALLTIFVATILVMTSPDESFAAIAADDDGVGPHDTPVSQVAKVLGAPLFSEKDFRSESTYLVAAVALAIEVTRFQVQGGEHTLDLLSDLDFSIEAQLAHLGDTDQDGLEIDLYGLSDAFFISQQSVEAEKPQFEPTALADSVHPLPIGPLVSMAEVHEIRVSTEGLQQLETHTPVEAEAYAVMTSIAYPQLAVVTGTDAAIGSRIDTSISDTDSASAAITWFEQKSSSDGWSVALLETSRVEAIQAVEFVEGLESQPNGADLPGIGVLREARDRAIELFRASDTDISAVKWDNGSLVIFDRSDVASGDNLSLVSWAFDEDGTTVAILGHSDVVADAVALIA